MKRFVAFMLLLPAFAVAQEDDDTIETLFGDAQGVSGPLRGFILTPPDSTISSLAYWAGRQRSVSAES